MHFSLILFNSLPLSALSIVRRPMRLLSALICLIALTGCNDDIFIDGAVLPDHTAVTIPGDAGRWSVHFTRQGLTNVYLEHTFDQKEYIRCYDIKGNVIPENSPASELASIVYQNPRRAFAIGLDGEMLYVDSYYNTAGTDKAVICLKYSHGVTKRIEVEMTAGKPLELAAVRYVGDTDIREGFDRVTHSLSYSNTTSTAQSFAVYPYRPAQCTERVESDVRWAQGLTADMAMPAYNGSEWELTQRQGIVLDESRSFDVPYSDDEKFTVDVAPHSSVTVTYTVSYSRATQRCILDFMNTVADNVFEAPVTARAVYPVGYEYTVTASSTANAR